WIRYGGWMYVRSTEYFVQTLSIYAYGGSRVPYGVPGIHRGTQAMGRALQGNAGVLSVIPTKSVPTNAGSIALGIPALTPKGDGVRPLYGLQWTHEELKYCA